MSKHQRLVVFSLTAILAVCGVAWLALNDKKPAASASRTVESVLGEADRSLGSSKAGLLKSAVPDRPRRIQKTQPSFEALAMAPDKTVAEAKDAARNGVPAAQRVLAEALYKCATANMGSDDDIELAIAKRSLIFEAARKNAGIADEKNAISDFAGQVADAKDTRESCRHVSVAESQTWLGWMEKAAIAGDLQARTDYAWTALNEYKTDEDRLANNDEYIRRRDLAFALLQDSIANRDCSDMLLNGFRRVSPDPATSYVYQSLLLQRGLAMLASRPRSQDTEQERASINQKIRELAAAVPVDQLAAADNSITYIQQNYCNQ